LANPRIWNAAPFSVLEGDMAKLERLRHKEAMADLQQFFQIQDVHKFKSLNLSILKIINRKPMAISKAKRVFSKAFGLKGLDHGLSWRLLCHTCYCYNVGTGSRALFV
jgi:hypothetical protein